ncbi:hypothetical protein EVAR_101495_1 [Eumeta japonica]|uniref:Uncharacterized protein n=1 Tax=Eumeta variegata TaxID=151549 RepID=A0A4C1SYV8_EUMVA|nr:hypothetical protein EVAR_101495_1 [Eumeta japonica]
MPAQRVLAARKAQASYRITSYRKRFYVSRSFYDTDNLSNSVNGKQEALPRANALSADTFYEPELFENLEISNANEELPADDNLEQESCQVEEILPEYRYQESKDNNNSKDSILLEPKQATNIITLNLTPDLEIANANVELPANDNLEQDLGHSKTRRKC